MNISSNNDRNRNDREISDNDINHPRIYINIKIEFNMIKDGMIAKNIFVMGK